MKFTKKKIISVFFLFIILAFLTGCVSSVANQNGSGELKAVMFKADACGCCLKYKAYLESKGVHVDVVSMPDISSIKQKYGVPGYLQSCHTITMNGHIIEGHVPFSAIDKMLSEGSGVKGITLPAMPAGSPGMPGVKSEDFKIYKFGNGESAVFMTV